MLIEFLTLPCSKAGGQKEMCNTFLSLTEYSTLTFSKCFPYIILFRHWTALWGRGVVITSLKPKNRIKSRWLLIHSKELLTFHHVLCTAPGTWGINLLHCFKSHQFPDLARSYCELTMSAKASKRMDMHSREGGRQQINKFSIILGGDKCRHQ